MKFKKIQYGGSEEIFETTILDGTGRRIENWKVMKRDFPQVVELLTKKFGLDMEIKINKKKDDLDWLDY